MDGSFEHIAWLKQRLGEQVTAVPVQGDRPLVLDDPALSYITLSEHHQLFCVGYRDGAPHGRREHLAICGPGQLLFGLAPQAGPDATVLLLSGVTGSVVWRLPTAALLALKERRDGRPMIVDLFESWIRLLIETLPPAPVPTRSLAVRAADVVDADPERALRADEPAQTRLHDDRVAAESSARTARTPLLWIAPRTTLSYRGISAREIGVEVSCWPLTEAAWALCDRERFKVWTTEELLAASGGARFTEGFYAFLVAVASRRRTELASARLAQDAASRPAERAQLGGALQELAAVGQGRMLDRFMRERPGGEAFERACRRIFGWLELDPAPRIVVPAGPALSHMQAALARMTGVRTRAVLLEGAWWKHDAGPLLGFVADGAEQHRPVALLPCGRGYELHDDTGGAPQRVTAALAQQLHPQAHQFYRTLPSGPLGPLHVLRFSAARVKRDLLTVLGVGLATGLVGTLVPLLTGQVFDRIIPGAERGLLVQLTLVLLAVYASSSLFDVARALALVRVQTRMDATLEAAVWDRLLSLPLPFFRRYSAGDLASRALGIGSIREVLAEVALSTLLSGLFSIWNFALLFYFDLRLALAATLLVTVAGAVAALASHSELAQRRKVAELDGKISGLLLQLLHGIAKLRATGSERRAFGVWARLFARRRDADLAGERVALRVGVFQSAFPIACTMTIFWLVGDGASRLSTGEFLAFNAAFSLFLRSVLEMIGAGLSALSVIPLYERARPILTQAIESPGQSDARITLGGAIEVSHVSFRYTQDSPLVLDDVTLRVEPGEFVAIVGPSGSGKSTLLRILLGFETPAEGGVYYDGQALTGLDVRSVRQQVGVVLQHSQITAGDIYANIAGSSGLSLDDAWRAARAAAFDGDIEAMPMGMHTVLAQGGGTLSGGQRQRLLIARALAAQPKILFFDEATSALDNRTQAQVSESLAGLRVTRVVIAHRLSSIQHADKIVVLERGRVVQVGRFERLLQDGGTFGALARRQMV